MRHCLPCAIVQVILRQRPRHKRFEESEENVCTAWSKNFFFKLHTGTLPVKKFLEGKGCYLPWGTHCLICKLPETIDHVFLHFWEGVYFWDVLQMALRKEFPLNPHGIRFLSVQDEDGLPFDAIMLMGLHSL